MGFFKKKIEVAEIQRVVGAKFGMGETVYKVSKESGASDIRISKGVVSEITMRPDEVRYWIKGASTGYESEVYGSFDEVVRALRNMLGEPKASGASE